MDIEEFVDQIIDRCCHAQIQHPDPVVQERIVRSDVWNILEDFQKEIADTYRSEIGELKEEIRGHEIREEGWV